MTTLVNLADATITRDGAGRLTFDDPGSPLLITLAVSTATETISELTITARHPTARINASSLTRLPLRQMRHLALTSKHPNDALWHAQARPKPVGSRSWGQDHWNEVVDVYNWALNTGRPGGGCQAIADMWHVAKNPTAYRWRRQAVVETGRTLADNKTR